MQKPKPLTGAEHAETFVANPTADISGASEESTDSDSPSARREHQDTKGNGSNQQQLEQYDETILAQCVAEAKRQHAEELAQLQSEREEDEKAHQCEILQLKNDHLKEILALKDMQHRKECQTLQNQLEKANKHATENLQHPLESKVVRTIIKTARAKLAYFKHIPSDVHNLSFILDTIVPTYRRFMVKDEGPQAAQMNEDFLDALISTAVDPVIASEFGARRRDTAHMRLKSMQDHLSRYCR
jgi:hypothetical protein